MKTVSVNRYDKEFKKQVDLLGYERAMKEMTPDTREELVRAFATGLPIEGSKQEQNRSIRGMSVAEGGDVIVKAIRVRYLHCEKNVRRDPNGEKNLGRIHVL